MAFTKSLALLALGGMSGFGMAAPFVARGMRYTSQRKAA